MIIVHQIKIDEIIFTVTLILLLFSWLMLHERPSFSSLILLFLFYSILFYSILFYSILFYSSCLFLEISLTGLVFYSIYAVFISEVIV